ncbi:MAG: hypothetical protein ACK4NZ_09825 [Tsuneonella sp.]
MAAGKPGTIDLFSFVTLPGDTHTVTVRSNSKKPVEIQLLDPGGNVVMQGRGVGTVSIKAVASWGDAYSVAVIRADAAAPYSVGRETVPATVQEFILAHMAGYTRQEDPVVPRCWLEPGKSLRMRFDDYNLDRTITGDEISAIRTYRNGRRRTSTQTHSIDGDVIAIAEQEDDGVRRRTLSLTTDRIRFDPIYRFTGYLC